jgi:hypothetical protein
MSDTVTELENQLDFVNTQIREKYLETLRISEAEVVFTKANGEKRTMRCTLDSNQIPVEAVPKSDGNATKVNESVIKAYDLDKQAWRSFRLDSVESFSPAG